MGHAGPESQELTKFPQTNKTKTTWTSKHIFYILHLNLPFVWYLTWHIPHGIVSNSKLSGETVREGSVTTEHSRTCTVGPCRTCQANSNNVTFASVESIMSDWESLWNPFMRNCPRNYLYWHDDAYVSHLHTGSLGVKFNREILSFTARQVFDLFKFHSKTWNNTLKGYFVFVNWAKVHSKLITMY